MTDDLRHRIAEALDHVTETSSVTGQFAVVPSLAAFTALVDAVMAVVEGLPDRGYCEHCGRGDCTPTAAQWDQERQRAEQAEAANLWVRRMAQVWIDIEPTHPTATSDGHTIAYAGREILAALDQPKEQT